MKSTKQAEKKRKYHHGNLRRALIEETAKLASREGVESVSLRRVAAAARVSPAAPYHHFKNKSDLLAAVAEEGFKRLHAAMTRAAGAGAAEAGVEGRLRRLGRAYVRFAVRFPHFFRVMFRPEIARAAEPDPDSWGQRAYFQLIRTIQEVMGEEGAPSEAVMKEAVYAWSVVHGLASLWVDGALSIEDPYAGWGIEAMAKYVTDRAGVGRNG